MEQQDMTGAFAGVDQPWMLARVPGASSGPPRAFILHRNVRRRGGPPQSGREGGNVGLVSLLLFAALCGVVVTASLFPAALNLVAGAAIVEAGQR